MYSAANVARTQKPQDARPQYATGFGLILQQSNEPDIFSKVNATWACTDKMLKGKSYTVQDAQLSKRDRAAGCVSFGQK